MQMKTHYTATRKCYKATLVLYKQLSLIKVIYSLNHTKRRPYTLKMLSHVNHQISILYIYMTAVI